MPCTFYGYGDAENYRHAAYELASTGLQLVPIHGVHADGCCGCGNPKCLNKWRHPISGEQWRHVATSDPTAIASWTNGDAPLHYGLVLGRESGVVEVVCPQALCLRDMPYGEWFGASGIVTPTYVRGFDIHRLFRFDERLPDAGVVKVGDVTVRMGCPGEATECITNCGYGLWCLGKSIVDVAPAEIPEPLLQAILGSHAAALKSQLKVPPVEAVRQTLLFDRYQ